MDKYVQKDRLLHEGGGVAPCKVLHSITYTVLYSLYIYIFFPNPEMLMKAGSSGGEEVMYESQMRRIAQIFRIMRILRSDFRDNRDETI